MVSLIRYKKSPVFLKTLKSRKFDFFRINPRAIVKMGVRRLARKGLVGKGAEAPPDNPNHFISRSFITHWAKTRFDDGALHVGFTVTIKAISKKATERNYVKRLLRAAANENMRDFRIAGHDFVFTARSDIKGVSFRELSAEMRRVLKFAECRIKEGARRPEE
ncbi:MAG: ribonuclease P protein component [Rickettsiales bacterium]|jgi:ribonuclease P protein component|nr:ribonuclease P protein component [Rickettsiales bacterium]